MLVLNRLKTLGVTAAFIFVVGCASSQTSEYSDEMGAPDFDDAMPEVEVIGIGDTEVFETDSQTFQELLDMNVYYFEFDTSDVNSEYMPALQAHSEYLIANPSVNIRVEGHTDERGSREYNIALGERRAQAVAQVLFANGVAQDQVSVVSYGAERPAVSGHGESAWKFNRRAVIVYENQ